MQQTWWGEITQARARIEALAHVLGPFDTFESLHGSETPAKDLLEDSSVAEMVIAKLSLPGAGKGEDDLCQWLYETYLTGDPDLQSVVLRFVPALCTSYVPRAASKPGQPLAGFEAVLLALYSAEYKARQGKPILVNIPNLAHPSLYHTPRVPSNTGFQHRTGQLRQAMEPQDAVKTTKRAAIVGVALDLYCMKIATMPTSSKREICNAIRIWATKGCSWAGRVDEISKIALLQAITPGPDPTLTGHVSTIGPSSSTSIFVPNSSYADDDDDDDDGGGGGGGGDDDGGGGAMRIPLPWELLQPILKILGHCLMGPSNTIQVKTEAAAAARALYARATHELIPEAILPSRALLRLDEASRLTSMAAAATAAAAAAADSTPHKPRKPEILLTPP